MAEAPRRIAMWSGPRNLSTAMMRSFGNRADIAAVWDEPFYAAYLDMTAKNHPMREAILASQPRDWRTVARACVEVPVPAGTVLYQKHMTHHMLPGIDRGWMELVTNVFLIRAPERVVASYAAKREEVALEDIGFTQQAEMFDRLADHLGTAPVVVDAEAIRADPEGQIKRLCAAIGLAFDPGMLTWEPGARSSDGVWGAHWYNAVNASTGFAPPDPPPSALTGEMRALADAARPFYDRLVPYML